MMLYKKNNTQSLDYELFKNPTAEYRGAPFWSWNCKLEKENLLEQIEVFKQMGLGGFHIHSRTGLDTEYMGEEFMQLVKDCHTKAVEEEMLLWLYDEDRWPSGYAGGAVSKNEAFRKRYLLFTPAKASDEELLLGKYEVLLDEKGCLAYYKKMSDHEKIKNEKSKIWYAYLKVQQPEKWYNYTTYIDVFNKEAVNEFIKTTYDKYKDLLGEHFGKTVPAIFDDEPRIGPRSYLSFPHEEKDMTLPFTTDFDDTFKTECGYSILHHLPEIIWNLPNNEVSTPRYDYFNHAVERFTSTFFDTIGEWCKKHNILFSAHMRSEENLELQSSYMGEIMRTYRSLTLPGIDILRDAREYNTVKQAQSIVRQQGHEGLLSELYGATNWDFDFRGYKLQGDWQAALGVTVRVHHLSLVSMAGESKRDYPPSINYQSPWHTQYSLIEDHFARLNTALSRGKSIVKIGVIHPIESFWLHLGPISQTYLKRKQMEKDFENLTEWLLFNLIDFDFICEGYLPENEYDVILVPNCHTIRETTLAYLENVKSKGGEIIFLGNVPSHIDAKQSNHAITFAKTCPIINYSEEEVISLLEPYRDIDITLENGQRTDHLLYQLRQDTNGSWLFIANGKAQANYDIPKSQKIKIKIKGCFSPILYDTIQGQQHQIPAVYNGLETEIDTILYDHDSLLLFLTEDEPVQVRMPCQKQNFLGYVDDCVPITLSDPNVYILDIAEYAFNNGDWQKEEELLRLNNKFREKLGYTLAGGRNAQPYADGYSTKTPHLLSLKFKIRSTMDVPEPYLAIEKPESLTIFLNGREVKSNVCGYFVDKSIKKIKLPPLFHGENELLITIPYGEKTEIEWCYLLGDFGVHVAGQKKMITEPVRKLHFGDWTTQGLPFYAGNVTYHCSYQNKSQKKLLLQVPQYRGPVMTVDCNGKQETLAFSPYTVSLENSNSFDITLYGNLINTFGQLHNFNKNERMYGPNTWRTQDIATTWSYAYQLKPMGILTQPRLYEVEYL